MLKAKNTAGPGLGTERPINESPWITFVDIANEIHTLQGLGAVVHQTNVYDVNRARDQFERQVAGRGRDRLERLSLGASTSAVDVDVTVPAPTYSAPQGAMIVLDDLTYWCQPKIWALRIAEPREVLIWKSRARQPPHDVGIFRLEVEFPAMLKVPHVLGFHVHEWVYVLPSENDDHTRKYVQVNQQALFATDEQTGRIVFLIGDEPIYDTEPEIVRRHEGGNSHGWGGRMVTVEQPRQPIYIDGKRQKIVGSRFEVKYDPAGWEPRWFK